MMELFQIILKIVLLIIVKHILNIVMVQDIKEQDQHHLIIKDLNYIFVEVI